MSGLVLYIGYDNNNDEQRERFSVKESVWAHSPALTSLAFSSLMTIIPCYSFVLYMWYQSRQGFGYRIFNDVQKYKIEEKKNINSKMQNTGN